MTANSLLIFTPQVQKLQNRNPKCPSKAVQHPITPNSSMEIWSMLRSRARHRCYHQCQIHHLSSIKIWIRNNRLSLSCQPAARIQQHHNSWQLKTTWRFHEGIQDGADFSKKVKWLMENNPLREAPRGARIQDNLWLKIQTPAGKVQKGKIICRLPMENNRVGPIHAQNREVFKMMRLVFHQGDLHRHRRPAASIPSPTPSRAIKSCPRLRLKLATLWTPMQCFHPRPAIYRNPPRRSLSWLTMLISTESFLRNSNRISCALRWNFKQMQAWCRIRFKLSQMSAQTSNDSSYGPQSRSKGTVEASSPDWKCAECITSRWSSKRRDWTMLWSKCKLWSMNKQRMHRSLLPS